MGTQVTSLKTHFASVFPTMVQYKTKTHSAFESTVKILEDKTDTGN